MKKLIAIFGLLAMAACGGDDAAETAETDAAAEPTPAAVVTEPVTPVTGDSMVTTPATTMPVDTGAAAVTP